MAVFTGDSLRNLLTGGIENDVLTGLGGNDTLNGGVGDDILDGGIGIDRMIGGAGNDTYVVNVAGDVVTEALGAGIDTIQTALVSYTAKVNVENLTFTGIGNFKGFGNNLGNAITGGIGNDTLNGLTGADTMSGGAGNDIYYIDNAGDIVAEAADGGRDIISSSISYVLGDNVENLTLTGTALTATGNSLNNHLQGTRGANIFDGGIGNDTMQGGLGNDTYFIDNAADVIEELARQGTDTVVAASSFTLGGKAANVENIGLAGTGDFNATGNSLANALTGNDGNNVLLGFAGNDTLKGGAGDDILDGGAGIDIMTGGAGIDLYKFGKGYGKDVVLNDGVNLLNVDRIVIDPTTVAGTGILVTEAAGDMVVKFAGNVADELRIKGTTIANGPALFYGTGRLLMGTSLDNTLTGDVTTNNIMFGLTGNDVLIGQAFDDTLSGGLGSDTMTGGAGNDTYYLENAGDVATPEGVNQGTDTLVYGVSQFFAPPLTLEADPYSLFDPDVAAGFSPLAEVSAIYYLPDNVENITMTGTGAHTAIGNSLNNIFVSNTYNSANQLLDVVNIFAGGAGNDTYYLDGEEDIAYEAAGEGYDIVYMKGEGIDLADIKDAVDPELVTRTNYIEEVHATGPITFAQDIVGNSLNNLFFGHNGDNVLEGMGGDDTIYGGLGTDEIMGGSGNDHLYSRGGGRTILLASAIEGGLGDDTYVLSVTNGITEVGNVVHPLDEDGKPDVKYRDGVFKGEAKFLDSGFDVLKFWENDPTNPTGRVINSTDVHFVVGLEGLEIRFVNVSGVETGAKIILDGWFDSSLADGSVADSLAKHQVDQIVFADVTLTSAQINALPTVAPGFVG